MRLLLCDDHCLFSDSLGRALAARGHEIVMITADPVRCVDELCRSTPLVCLLDVTLADVSGLDVAATIRRRAPETLIVLTTGMDADTIWAALDAGLADGAVSKDCDVDTICRVLQRVARGERAVEGWSRPVPRKVESAHSGAALTARETEILQLLVEGTTTVEMAERLGLSQNTVRSHVQNLLRKLDVHGRGKAAHMAVSHGLTGSWTSDSVASSA